MYYAMRASAPSLHRESTDSLIIRATKFSSYGVKQHWITFGLSRTKGLHG